MKTIWKFELDNSGTQGFEMPKNAEILTVQNQSGTLCLWAIVDTENKPETRHFEIFGTGNPIYCDMGVDRRFIGTCQLVDGLLVFHVFERLT